MLTENGYEKYIRYSYDSEDPDKINAINFGIKNSTTEDIVQSYYDMIDIRDMLRKSYEKEIEDGGDLEDFYDNLNAKIKDMSEGVKEYEDALSDYDINKATISFNEDSFGGIKGSLIETKEELASWINAMLASEDISDGVKNKLRG